MLVCHCHKVSSSQIRACAQRGDGLVDICKRLRAGTACGGCMSLVSELVELEQSSPSATTSEMQATGGRSAWLR